MNIQTLNIQTLQSVGIISFLSAFRNTNKAFIQGINKKEAVQDEQLLLESGGDLLFRAVSSQVPSALKGLTSVFGMGTGGTPSPLPPEIVYLSIPHLDNCTSERRLFVSYVSLFSQTFVSVSLKSSPRPISIITLHPLPDFHR